jgi:hypothetical protein
VSVRARIALIRREVKAGFALPIRVLAASWRDPATRRRYLRVTGVQFVIIAAVMCVAGPSAVEGLKAARGHGWQVTFGRAGLVLSTLYATLCTTEWVVLALFRDYNDALIAKLSRVSGVCSEAGPHRPRIRMDLAWLWRRAVRQVQGAILLASATPFVLLADAIAGRYGAKAILAVWGTYWLAVLTIGKSALAWHHRPPRPPWFLRGLDQAGARVQWLDSKLPRMYRRLWARLSRSTWAPAIELEEAPFRSAGLVAARMVAGIPGVSVFMRPLIPVAAAHIILRRDVAASLATDLADRGPGPSRAYLAEVRTGELPQLAAR